MNKILCMCPRPTHCKEVPGGGAAIYYNSHAARPGIWLCHGGVLFWMVDAFKHLKLSIPMLSIYERVLFFVLWYCVVKYANIFHSCCKESSRPEFGNLRQRQFFHVGINIILRTIRINTRERFFCNIWYHTGWKPVPYNWGTTRFTMEMRLLEPFFMKRRSPLDPESSRTLIVLFLTFCPVLMLGSGVLVLNAI